MREKEKTIINLYLNKSKPINYNLDCYQFQNVNVK